LVQLELEACEIALASEPDFNPTLVQLESEPQPALHITCKDFNPTLVQLELNSARYSGSSTSISIPHWCN